MSDGLRKVRRYTLDDRYPEVSSSFNENQERHHHIAQTGDDYGIRNITSALPVGVNELKHNYHVRRYNLDVNYPRASSCSKENEGGPQFDETGNTMNNLASALPSVVNEFNDNHQVRRINLNVSYPGASSSSRPNQKANHQFSNAVLLTRQNELSVSHPGFSSSYIKYLKKHESVGDGYEKFTKEILRKEEIILNSGKIYPKMIRDLLKLHFSIETLKTHSLSGKQSSAFKDKLHSAKPQLDPEIVARIEQLIGKKCMMPRSIVRRHIAIACADSNRRVIK